VQLWFSEHQPTVVVLAAAKVGGIQANNSYPADFLLENLKIQTNVIEAAHRAPGAHQQPCAAGAEGVPACG